MTTIQTVTLHSGDLQEMLPDTARMLGNFVAPCDLVYRDEGGLEKVLYDCITSLTPDNACAPLPVLALFAVL